MLPTWHSVGSFTRKQFQRFAKKDSSQPHYESVPLDDVSEPLLPSSFPSQSQSSPHHPTPAFHSTKRYVHSRWRLKPLYYACFTLFIMLLLCSPQIIKFLHPYADPGYDETFLPSYIPQPRNVELDVPPIPSNAGVELGLAELQKELASRLASLGMPAARPQIYCTTLDSTPSQSRYHHIQQSHQTHGRTLIALNLFESGDVLPSIGRALLELVYFLGQSSVHVSIFENGSRKDNTTLGLAHLAAVLTAAEVPHTILSDPNETPWDGIDRIEQLAIYRNLVIEPLYSSVNLSSNADVPEARQFTNVLFINDVFFCADDALELLHVRTVQDAHATCGLDYRWRHNFLSGLLGSGPKFYDSWVSRTLNGNTFRARLDAFAEFRDGLRELFQSDWMSYFSSAKSDRAAKRRFDNARVIPVFSCWNGMIALDSRPFLGIGVQGEDLGDRTTRFRGARREQKECASSECKILAKDFWAAGYDRWVLVPFVRTTYEYDLYNHHSLEGLAARARGRWRSPPPSLISLPHPPSSIALSAVNRSGWTYPSSPHPKLTQLDEFSLLPQGLSGTTSDDGVYEDDHGRIILPRHEESRARKQPSHRSGSEVSTVDDRALPPPVGEELDLIAWPRIQGPVTVVCWPYHNAKYVEWWWTKVIEKVKAPIKQLRR